MPPAEKIVVIDGAPTPIGSFGGAFKDVPSYTLGSLAAREVLSRAAVRAGDVDEVVMGCIGQVGSDAYDARRTALSASGTSQGAAAAVIARKSVAKERGLTPLVSLKAVATGANLTLRVAKHLARSDGEWGIVTMCISGGRALAALFRRVP
jgi:acetyl-CoA acetyltransferase